MKQAAVIGAGISGLAAALRLASEGFFVTVFEKNRTFGGKAGEIKLSGFRFDTGPSLITMRFVIDEILSLYPGEVPEYIVPDKICRYYYGNGIKADMPSGIDDFAEEAGRQTEENPANITKYLMYSKKIYDLTADIFLFNEFTFRKLIKINPILWLKILSIDPFRNMNRAIKDYIKSEKLQMIFNRYATYNGSNPYLAPATLNIISWVENGMGACYIKGGIRRLPEMLYERAVNAGVNFKFTTDVKSISQYSGNQVEIGLNDKNAESSRVFDVVVSAADIFRTDKISGKETKYDKKSLSTSAIIFFWGIKINSENLILHNILFSSDYKNEFDQLSKGLLSKDPTVYIYISSKVNPEDSLEGCENWFVMINVPPGYEPGNIDSVRAGIVRKIEECTGLSIKDKIVSEDYFLPRDLEENTFSTLGSLYGNSSNSAVSAFKRRQCESRKIKNLFYCGGTVHPGGGIPLVLLSAKIAVNKITEKFREGKND